MSCAAAVGDVDVVAVAVCISAECVVAPSPHAAVVGGAVELRPAVVADYDTAAAVDIAVDQIFSPCCPHTP